MAANPEQDLISQGARFFKEQNFRAAEKCFLKAVDDFGSAEAAYILGSRRGFGFSIQKMESYLNMAVKKEYAPAQFVWANYLLVQGARRSKEAFEYLLRAAIQDHPDAQEMLFESRWDRKEFLASLNAYIQNTEQTASAPFLSKSNNRLIIAKSLRDKLTAENPDQKLTQAEYQLWLEGLECGWLKPVVCAKRVNVDAVQAAALVSSSSSTSSHPPILNTLSAMPHHLEPKQPQPSLESLLQEGYRLLQSRATLEDVHLRYQCTSKAKECFLKAVHLYQSPEARYVLATEADFVRNTGVQKVRFLLLCAAQQGYAPAQFKLANDLIDQGKTAEAREWFEKAAARDHAEAKQVLDLQGARKALEQYIAQKPRFSFFNQIIQADASEIERKLELARILLAKLNEGPMNREFSQEEVELIYSPDLIRKKDPLAKIVESHPCLQLLLKGEGLVQNLQSSGVENSAGVLVKRRLI